MFCSQYRFGCQICHQGLSLLKASYPTLLYSVNHILHKQIFLNTNLIKTVSSNSFQSKNIVKNDKEIAQVEEFIEHGTSGVYTKKMFLFSF